MAKTITVEKDLITNGICLLGGAIAGRFVGSKAAALLPASVPAPFANVIPAGIGIYMMFQKNPMLVWAGAGMFAASGSRALGELIPALGAPSAMPNRSKQYLLNQNTRRTISLPANQANLSRPANTGILSYPANQANMSGVFNQESAFSGARFY